MFHERAWDYAHEWGVEYVVQFQGAAGANKIPL